MILALFVFAAALFIDGATDCANAATGAVSSGTLSIGKATTVCALLSFIGCLTASLFFPSVAQNTAKAATVPEEFCAAAVISALIAVSLWSGAAWVMGLPTSEGHGLIAATAGAALALGGTIDARRFIFVISSMVPSAILAVILSLLFAYIFKSRNFASLRVPVIASCALSAFFHGAQDGQKFLALAMSASFIPRGARHFAVIFAAFFMGAGTLFGSRIIRKMGEEMTRANNVSALSSDLGSAAALAALTALGIPASTTHLKMTSLAAASGFCKEKTDKSTVLLMIAAWIATFPVCFALSFFISKWIFVILL